MSLCVVCNGIYEAQIPCSTCMNVMNHYGKQSDLYDAYSPYSSIEVEVYCTHQFYCVYCNNTVSMSFQMEDIEQSN